MSHVHVKINFSFGIDSWNRCLSVHKRLQIRAQMRENASFCTSEIHELDSLRTYSDIRLTTFQ
jgi:hypothetical protein